MLEMEVLFPDQPNLHVRFQARENRFQMANMGANAANPAQGAAIHLLRELAMTFSDQSMKART